MQPQQLIDFIGNHWVLFAALGVILALLAHNLIVGGKGSVDPSDATELINHRDALVVDVRPTADFSKGHIINAVNIPMNGLKNQLGRLDKYKQKPVIVACRSGAQSASAGKQLRNAGFEKVYDLKGGIMAWQSASLPISRKS